MTKPPKALPVAVCDTVTHKSIRPASSSSQDPRAAKSSKALGDALLTLLDRKPFDQITIRDIVAEAGVHYATFFRHHPTKESLFDQVAADQIEQMISLTLPAFERAEEGKSFLALCSYIDSHSEHWRAFFKSGATAAMREKMLSISHAYTNTLDLPAQWPPLDLRVIYSVSIVMETLAWWLSQPPERYSIEQVADILYRATAAMHIHYTPS